MKEQYIKVLIDGQPLDQQDMAIWMAKRLKKAYKIFHETMDLNDTLSDRRMKLTDIKAQYTDDEMRAILKRKLAVSRLMMKMACVFSAGKRRVARTTIFASGITAEKFSQQLNLLMTVATEENRKVNLSVYPEHYLLSPDQKGTLEVIETTGNAPLPTQFFIAFHDETGLVEKRNPQYTHQSAGIAKLNDGTIIGGVRHQFRNTQEGLEGQLAVEFPALCPKTIVRSHQKHLAIEFTNWIKWIMENGQ